MTENTERHSSKGTTEEMQKILLRVMGHDFEITEAQPLLNFIITNIVYNTESCILGVLHNG